MNAQALVCAAARAADAFAFPLMVELFREKLCNEKRGRPHRAHGRTAGEGRRAATVPVGGVDE